MRLRHPGRKDRTVRRPNLFVLTVFGVLLAAAACSADSGTTPTTDGSADSPTTLTPETTLSTTTSPPAVRAVLQDELPVEGAYRQGLARVDDGWIFSTNDALFRTDDELNRTVVAEPALPAELTSRGFNHIGDIDVYDGIVYAPVEQPDFERGQQVMARYDAATLTFVDATDVAQDHLAWVAISDDGATAYSMSGFTDDTILTYTLPDWAPGPPIVLDREIARVQGGDVTGASLWLSTDEELETDEGPASPPGTGPVPGNDGLYVVDLTTGSVERIADLPRPDGEAEGIDATDLPSGLLHVLAVDAELLPVWLAHFAVE